MSNQLKLYVLFREGEWTHNMAIFSKIPTIQEVLETEFAWPLSASEYDLLTEHSLVHNEEGTITLSLWRKPLIRM